MQTLVIVSHPDVDNSSTQQFLQQGAHLVQAKWHYLDKLETYNVVQERQLLLNSQRIIFQFPLYWYTSPASLAKWLAQVLSTKFLDNLEDKELGLAVSTGLPAKDFQAGGKIGYHLDQILTPYQALAQQAKMIFLPIFAIYQFSYLSEIERLQLLMDYQRYLSQTKLDSLKNRSDWYLNYFQHQQLTQNQTTQLIQDTFRQTTQELDNLQTTLKLIKQDEDDTLE
ncbi:NAD(P)H-dependent oxidoreductase [Bombilactobacillus bombi]|uniref:NAD(P)H-dependent oxidoreductase n=1 Tax=Bombilactobacillus bombi TaxID=1303590 RepID=UPI0015E5A006|nr:NAD(P)H-dependent oxidoreductase [Bombilactobacillus bombi]